ncbi:MAG: GTP cyclohydrolase I FolE [Microthrixaceae bacterium]
MPFTDDDERIGECLISAEAIQDRVREIGARITADFAGREPVVVCVLKGAYAFVTDLVRCIDLPVELDFISVASYGSATRSSGVVRLLKDLDESIAGRDVILVEDIIDSGRTLRYLRRSLEARDPARCRFARCSPGRPRRATAGASTTWGLNWTTTTTSWVTGSMRGNGCATSTTSRGTRPRNGSDRSTGAVGRTRGEGDAHSTGVRVSKEQSEMDLSRIEAAVREILAAIGEDPDREGLSDTPGRVARMFAETCAGLHMDPARHLDTTFAADHDELVLVRDIPFYSMCEHHLVPFFGRAHVGYIPSVDGRITGLSKLARLVDETSRRPQVQERLTTQVADSMERALAPRGVVVVMEAEHLCMAMRGVRKPGTLTVTSAVRGLFRSDSSSRAEVMRLISGS